MSSIPFFLYFICVPLLSILSCIPNLRTSRLPSIDKAVLTALLFTVLLIIVLRPALLNSDVQSYKYIYDSVSFQSSLFSAPDIRIEPAYAAWLLINKLLGIPYNLVPLVDALLLYVGLLRLPFRAKSFLFSVFFLSSYTVFSVATWRSSLATISLIFLLPTLNYSYTKANTLSYRTDTRGSISSILLFIFSFFLLAAHSSVLAIAILLLISILINRILDALRLPYLVRSLRIPKSLLFFVLLIFVFASCFLAYLSFQLIRNPEYYMDYFSPASSYNLVSGNQGLSSVFFSLLAVVHYIFSHLLSPSLPRVRNSRLDLSFLCIASMICVSISVISFDFIVLSRLSLSLFMLYIFNSSYIGFSPSSVVDRSKIIALINFAAVIPLLCYYVYNLLRLDAMYMPLFSLLPGTGLCSFW